MNSEFYIGKTLISQHSAPYFIADIAANHDGDLQRAYKLIELAKQAGADVAKFQNFKAEKIVSDYGFKNLGGQLSHQKNWKKSVFETYADASVSDDWSPLLKQKCDEVGIEYMTSAYDFKSVDLADNFVNAFKIGSGDISWHEMLEYTAKKNKPMLVATGAASLEEVQMAVEKILPLNPNLCLMQCNTNYTASSENFKYINLRVLKAYAQMYPQMVLGLSDHTIGHTAVLGAIALGATVIEKHFTDDNDRIGPDHKFSTTPTQWAAMVKDANNLYNALGDGVKRVEENEKQTCIVQKRGLYLVRDIQKGEIISAQDLQPLRPRSDEGFEPWQANLAVGKAAKCDLAKGVMLKKGDIEG
ncbi:MAG: N-acetylneuraminate synthase family protein [Oscillospiraceae bacterium]